MKIGIMTFWWSEDNYGQVLQCYALQKYLQDKGHDAYLIRYNYTKDIAPLSVLRKILYILNIKKLCNYLKYKYNSKKIISEQQFTPRHFDNFRNEYIIQSKILYTHYEELRNNPPEADCYIVGSDQVWNHNENALKRLDGPVNAYFLNFGDANIKRFAYAASWGKTKISVAYKNKVSPLLSRFDYVSVREESGLELCHHCGVENSEWVCDPTLLLSAEVYRGIYKKSKINKPNKKYILLYVLNNAYLFNIQKVYDFALQNQLEVIYVTGNGVVDNRKKYFATISEWLYLVDNAEYIITNSFHCCVFSLIFNKNVGIIPASGRDQEMNSRFDSLFAMFNISERYVSENDFTVLNKTYEKNIPDCSNKFLDLLQNTDD